MGTFRSLKYCLSYNKINKTSKPIISIKPKNNIVLKKFIATYLLTSIVALTSTTISTATEFDLLAEDEPNESYLIDDASVLSMVARDEINNKLYNLEKNVGYKIVVATTRKLEFNPDAFTFSEKIFGKWHRSNGGDKDGLILIVTTSKDGALIGGDSFKKAIGDDLIDSIVGENISVYTEKEKFNEAAISSINRIISVLEGKADPGAPRREDNTRKRTYKTKEETEKVKPVTGSILITLLFIAFVVPMLQFYGYVSKE